jgi:hypothetical protein
MVKKQKILLLSWVLFALISQSIIYGQEARTYHEFKPKVVIDEANRTLYELSNDFFVYEDWYQIKGKNERCLFGVLGKGKEFKTIYRSKGAGDSYYLKLSFFKTNQGSDPIVILGEAGAEYSWGISVFFVKGNLIQDIGFLDVGAELKYDHGDTVVSAVPYTKVTTDGKRFKFTFTKDMVYVVSADFDLIKKENIYYVYEDGKLKEIIKK